MKNKMDLKMSDIINALNHTFKKEDTVLHNILKALVIIPFAACVIFLKVLGHMLHLTYVEISVIFNLYLQGGLLALSGICPFAAQCIRFSHHTDWQNMLILFLLMSYAVVHLIGFRSLIRHYPLPMEKAFDTCVSDLQALAREFKISYWAVNLIIFIWWWLTMLGLNIWFTFTILTN